jgi:cathepsin A (carboxypeptidase C)
MCSDSVQSQYVRQYNDTTQFFNQMINAQLDNFKILLYNGDVDFICNHIGNQWFVEALAASNSLQVSQQHQPWYYRNQTAGYLKEFQKGSVTIDLVTVKGAGHLAPIDRPGLYKAFPANVESHMWCKIKIHHVSLYTQMVVGSLPLCRVST